MSDFEDLKEAYMEHMANYLPRPLDVDIMNNLRDNEIGRHIANCSVEFAWLILQELRAYQIAASEWMDAHDKLKEKYEPSVASYD